MMIAGRPATINRHERLSHFSDFKRRNKNGDLLNDNGQTPLETLEFKTYKDLANWLAKEFVSKDLNWRKLNVGSPYPIALLIVIAFLEDEKIENWFVSPFIARWIRLGGKKRKYAFQNFKRLFSTPELHNPINKRFLLEYKLFRAILQGNGLS